MDEIKEAALPSGVRVTDEMARALERLDAIYDPEDEALHSLRDDLRAALTALRAERERLERERGHWEDVARVAEKRTAYAQARVAELEKELEQAENDEQEWMEKATYEVGAVPHLWSDRAKAAEARNAELVKEVDYYGGLIDRIKEILDEPYFGSSEKEDRIKELLHV